MRFFSCPQGRPLGVRYKSLRPQARIPGQFWCYALFRSVPRREFPSANTACDACRSRSHRSGSLRVASRHNNVTTTNGPLGGSLEILEPTPGNTGGAVGLRKKEAGATLPRLVSKWFWRRGRRRTSPKAPEAVATGCTACESRVFRRERSPPRKKRGRLCVSLSAVRLRPSGSEGHCLLERGKGLWGGINRATTAVGSARDFAPRPLMSMHDEMEILLAVSVGAYCTVNIGSTRHMP